MSKYFKWLELPAREDIYTDRGTTKWGNHDLYPIVPKERTYGKGAFLLYWLTCCAGLSTFAIGSSYIAVGLTAGEACGAVLIGGCIASTNAILCGRPGAEKHMGYTMLARVAFGLRGMWLPLFFQILGNMVFFGLQAVYGGQAIGLMLGSIFPQWKNMKNTLPASAGTDTKDLVGFFIYIILYLPIVTFIKPHKLEKFMWPAFILTVGTIFGIMGWAIAKNGGSAGSMVTPAIDITSATRAFRFIQCISGVAGTYGGSADRFSDWTRFSKKKNDYLLGASTAMPICITICGLLGVLTASATRAYYGEAMWQPLQILYFIQDDSYNSSGRALTFFAGLAIWSHQVFVNVTQNNVGAGMDLAGIFPRYISTQRGALLLTAFGVLLQPWRFFTQATVFLAVISSFGVFASVTTAVLVLDYWVVRKRTWKIPDLFVGNTSSIYWYWHGANLRSCVVFIITIIPSFPGLVLSIMGRKSGAAVRIYQINYIVGFVFGCILYYGVNHFYPPPGLGISEEFDAAHVGDGLGVTTVEGVAIEGDTTGGSESDIVTSKEMHVSGKQVEGDSV